MLKLAIRALGGIGSPEALSVLEAQLSRDTPQLRWLALEAILSDPGGVEVARPHLEAFATGHPSERNRRFAMDALADLD